jgi:chorismate mutase
MLQICVLVAKPPLGTVLFTSRLEICDSKREARVTHPHPGTIQTMIRGIRGATTVSENTSTAINDATRELLVEMLRANELAQDPTNPTQDELEPLCSIIFTVTQDLNAAFPAEAARNALGMKFVPLLNALEIHVPGRLTRAIRVMMHVNTDRAQREVRHVYLRDAVVLRPDLESAQ